METSAASRPVPRPAIGARSAVLLRVASDDRLVHHVRAGSEAAFEVVYDRHHRGILAFCRHMLGSAEEAEDAVQHTFMAAYRDLLGSEKAIQLRPWLYTIARNRCFSMLRARRERPLGEMDEPATENLSSEVQRRQDLRDLLADLSGLPDDQRAALVLAELGAVSHDEIATVLDVPRDKVKALVFQARTSLIASRTARDTPCEEIREQLANLRGGSLRRTTLRRHLRECAGCRAFRDEVTAQRRALAVALPVLPTLGLKDSALAAAFGSGSAGGGAAAAAAGAGAGAVVSSAAAGGGGAALAAKALVAVALVGGGTAAGVKATHHPERGKSAASPAAPPATPSRHGVAGAAGAAGAAGVATDTGPNEHANPAATGEDDDQGNMAHGRKTRTRTRTRGANPRHAGGGPAVRAHGRTGAPGRARVKREKQVKQTHDRGKTGAVTRPPKIKPRATRPAETRSSLPRAQRPVKVVPVAPNLSTPRVRPVKPVQPLPPVPTVAVPTVTPAPAANGNANGKLK